MAEEVSLAAPSDDEKEINDKVRQLEEIFKDRYTEKDEVYMKTVATPLPDPPCVKNWFVRQRGNWNRGRGGHRGSGDRRSDDRYGNRGNYHGNRDNYHGNRDNYHGNRDNYHQGHSYGGDHRQRYDNYGQHGNRGRDDRRYNPY